MNWESIVTNDPDDDYNLILEVWNNENHVCTIKRVENELIVIWYASSSNINIPADFLIHTIERSKKEVFKM